MQITMPQKVLAAELALLATVVEKRTTIPILSNIRLAAQDGLTLTATDLDRAITSTVECSVKEPGAITIPASRLQHLVASLDGEVTIRTDANNYATITAGRSRSRIPGMSPEAFPELPAMPEGLSTIDAGMFARLMARVQFAISMEETRFTLNGALVEIQGAQVRVVATDGHRLAWTQAEGATGTDCTFLVHRATMVTYSKLATGRVAISTDENHLFFACGNRVLVSRKMTGNFPDYKRAMPSLDTYVVVDREEWKASIARVGQFADERSRAIRLNISAGEIRMFASAVECGDAEESIPCEGTSSVELGFNCQYISEALSAIDHPKVALYVKDSKSPCEIRPMTGAGDERDPLRVGTDSRYITMPMRI